MDDNLAYDGSSPIDHGQFDLGDLLSVLIESRWLIATVGFSIFLLGLAYTLVATPIYQAGGLIQVEEKKSGLGDLDINSLFEGDATVSAEVEILRSRLVLGAVVDNLRLEIIAEPKYFPLIGEALARHFHDSGRSIKVETLELPPSLVGQPLTLVSTGGGSYELFDTDGRQLITGRIGEKAGTTIDGDTLTIFVSDLQADVGDTYRLERQTRLKAIETLQASLSVSERGKGSGILSLNLEGKDPSIVSRQVNEIANVYVRQNVERRSAEAEKTLAFLEEQLPSVRQDMEAAEVALNTYRLEKGSVDLTLETQSVLETIVAIESQLNELEQERDKVTQGFTPAHPVVIALDKQIERLNRELSQLNDQVRELPNTQQEVLRLVRDTEVNTALYTSLLNTAQELRVVKAGTVGNVRVIDYAVTPYKPIKPRRSLILMLSAVIGVFAGIAVAVVRRALHGGVEDPDFIEKRINVPVYATIAHSTRQKRLFKRLQSQTANNAILAVDSPNDVAIESLRNLRTALHFGLMDAKNNCIMIAGPSPTVGKSFVSVNLSAVLANSDKKVLLIDGDLRRGHLHEYLGLSREHGLSDFISGEAPIGKVLHQTSIDGLTFIPTGVRPPNPAELLLHQRFRNCMNVLAPRFDHIIIDSPPILAVTDAIIIGQMAGATLLVLKSGEHLIREIELSVRRLHQAKVNLRGILLNDANLQSRRYGAGKYAYQYAYKK